MADEATRAAEAEAARMEAAARDAQADAERAIQEKTVVQKELDKLRDSLKAVSEQADMLSEQAIEAKKEGRRTKIASALSFVKSAAGRRTVHFPLGFFSNVAIFLQMKKLMELLFFVEDGDDVWRKLADEAELEGHKIVTADMSACDIDRVNK